MSTGKAVAQGAHASMMVYESIVEGVMEEVGESYIEDCSNEWLRTGMTKVVLACKDLATLEKAINKAKSAHMPWSLITDEGRTEFDGVPTVTCGAIGPFDSDQINKITKRLRLY